MYRLLSLAISLVLLGSLSAEAQVTLKHKTAENSQLSTTVKTSTSQVLTIVGMDLETKVKQTMVAEQTSGTRAKDGTLEVVETVKSLQVDGTYPGGAQISYDSSKENTPAGTQVDFLLGLFDVIASSKTAFKLDRAGNCLSVAIKLKGLDELPEEVKPLLAEQSDTGYLRDTYNMRLKEVPATPLKVGESWVIEFPMKLGDGQILETKRTMTYKGVEMTASGKKLHVITGVTNDAQLVQSPDVKGAAPVSDSKLTVKSSSIRILFDNELGRPTLSEYKLQLAGSITLTINGMALPCQIDLTMDIAAATR